MFAQSADARPRRDRTLVVSRRPRGCHVDDGVGAQPHATPLPDRRRRNRVCGAAVTGPYAAVFGLTPLPTVAHDSVPRTPFVALGLRAPAHAPTCPRCTSPARSSSPPGDSGGRTVLAMVSAGDCRRSGLGTLMGAAMVATGLSTRHPARRIGRLAADRAPRPLTLVTYRFTSRSSISCGRIASPSIVRRRDGCPRRRRPLVHDRRGLLLRGDRDSTISEQRRSDGQRQSVRRGRPRKRRRESG